jgi:MMP 1-O-methyltransferase
VNAELIAIADRAKGWLFPAEGQALYEAALSIPAGPIVEVGSYCGKSTVYLGQAARDLGTVVFAVDHHRGSPEMQTGQPNCDPAVFANGAHDTLGHFRATIAEASLEDHVVAVVGESTQVAIYWRTPVGMVFIDAAHAYLQVRADFVAWASWVMPGGVLAFHDVTIADIERVATEAEEHGFVRYADVDSLRLLRRPA